MHVGLSRINRPGGMFSGAVSMPAIPFPEVRRPEIPASIMPEPAAKQPEQVQTFSGLVLGRLTNLHPTSEELKARLQDAISEASVSVV